MNLKNLIYFVFYSFLFFQFNIKLCPSVSCFESLSRVNVIKGTPIEKALTCMLINLLNNIFCQVWLYCWMINLYITHGLV